MLPTTRSSEPGFSERCHLYDIDGLRSMSISSSGLKTQLHHISRYAAKKVTVDKYFSPWFGMARKNSILCVIFYRGRSQPSRCRSIAFNETARDRTHLHTFTETKKGTLQDRITGCDETSISNNIILKYRIMRTQHVFVSRTVRPTAARVFHA